MSGNTVPAVWPFPTWYGQPFKPAPQPKQPRPKTQPRRTPDGAEAPF